MTTAHVGRAGAFFPQREHGDADPAEVSWVCERGCAIGFVVYALRVGCHATVLAQRDFLDLAHSMLNIMNEDRRKHFCALCTFVVFPPSA